MHTHTRRFASPAECAGVFGFVPGTMPPLGHRDEMMTMVDDRLTSGEILLCGGLCVCVCVYVCVCVCMYICDGCACTFFMLLMQIAVAGSGAADLYLQLSFDVSPHFYNACARTQSHSYM